MNTTVKNLPRGQAELEIELTIEEYRPFLEQAAQTLSQETSIPGFRPGHATYETVKQRVGEQKIWEEALEPAIKKTLFVAIDEQKLQTIGSPAIDILMLAPGNPVRYKATVNLLPTVILPDLQTISVTKKTTSVTDEEVEKALDQIRKMRRKEVREERAAQTGDKVDVDFDISLDKVLIDGGTYKKFPVVIGENMFLPGFEEQLIGMKANDSKEFSLDIPKDHHQKMIAGKSPSFKVTVNGVFKLETPELNEAFAKTLGDFADVEALRKDVKENLQHEADHEADMRLEDEMINAIIEKCTFGDMPDLLIDAEAKKMIGELEQNVAQRGIPFEDYLNHLKKTRAELLLDFTPQAIVRIKSALIIREVAKKDNITASVAELDQELTRLKLSYQSNPEALKTLETEEYLEYLRNIVTSRNVINHIKAIVVK